jgi:DNA-binding transcriptional ArsR family regulator
MVAKLDRHAVQLAALGHPVRLKALRFVVQAGAAGAPAGDIQSHVGLPPSTLSHHLKRLATAGLLRTRLEGTFHYYAVDYRSLKALTDYVWEDCCKRGDVPASCC